MEKDNLIKVGKFKDKFNELMGTNLPVCDIYQSKGLSKHMIKSGHGKCLKYLDNIADDNDYIYVSTMHDVQESKISNRLHSGRIKKMNNDVDNQDK